MKNIFISIIIPIYNEEKRIEKCLKKIETYFLSDNQNYEVILVDDASTDKSVEIIEKAIKHKKNFHLLRNEINHGKGYVVKKGMMMANGKNILFIDADLSTPIEELSKLLLFIDGYPVVIGSRYLNPSSIKIKQPFARRVISRLGNLAIKVVLGLSYSDTQCGFKLFQNKPAKAIFSRLTIERWGFDIELLTIAKTLGYNVKEVAVSWSDDRNSKLRAGRDAINTLKELFRIRKNVRENKYK